MLHSEADIDSALAILKSVWMTWPEQRLPQIIGNVFPDTTKCLSQPWRDPYSMGSHEFVMEIRKSYACLPRAMRPMPGGKRRKSSPGRARGVRPKS